MSRQSYEVIFDGGILRRGFWLYVWEITPIDGPALYYVGRMGDSASTNAQSPFNRMGQHLGFIKNNNMLRRHLENRQVEPERCEFRLVAHGPIKPESKRKELAEHIERRDRVAAMERALAAAMRRAGCDVMNDVRCSKLMDANAFAGILAAFSAEFPALATSYRGETGLADRPYKPARR